jgi:hypothetical protein
MYVAAKLLAASGCTGCGKLGYLLSAHRCRDCSVPFCEDCTVHLKNCSRCDGPIVPRPAGSG